MISGQTTTVLQAIQTSRTSHSEADRSPSITIDKTRTRQVLRESQTRGDQVYFLFIGACEHEEFDFVEGIAKEFKNTGIVMATDPEEFANLPDEELIAKLLDPELVAWLKR